MAGSIAVVGLGPGSAEHVTVQTRALLKDVGRRVILRTRRHPSVETLDPSGRFENCDDLYGSGGDFASVYASIAERVVAAAAEGDVVFAVPGHPLVAEASVELLLAAAAGRGIEARVYPAVSYVDVAAVALRRDLGGVQLCDALDLRIDAQRPALIAQVFSRDAASALKLRLLETYPAEHPVTILSALGTAEEAVRELPLHELDREARGYLDSLFVPALAPAEDVRRFDGLYAIVSRLHAPGGCPWDREQTHESLRPHLLEESYEVLEAIDAGDSAQLTEELGDLLLQVVMHTAVAERTEEFSFADVTEQIARKLVRRHPHVFGDVVAENADEVARNWDAIKQSEKPRTSILDGLPEALPALAASQSIQGRARRVGFDWPDIEGPLAKLVEEVGEFARAEGSAEREDEFGDILFVLANVSQRLGIDAEQALRRANGKFRRRFGTVERLADERGLDLRELDLGGLDAIWDEAKAIERALL